jgi:hypothetical protein
MSSTRRTPRKLAAAYNWLAAAAAVMAAVMAAAEVVAGAEAAAAAVQVVVVAAAALVAAVHPGALAAGAKPNYSPIALTKAKHHGRVRQGRPGQLMLCLQHQLDACEGYLKAALGGRVGGTAREGRMVFQTYPEMRAREPDGEAAVTGVYRLRRRSGGAGKVRVMTS